MSAFDPEDGGWASKKLHFGLLSVALVFLGWLATNWLPGLVPSFTTMVGGITGAFAVFCGANLANKFVVGKNIIAQKQAPVDDPDAETPDPE